MAEDRHNGVRDDDVRDDNTAEFGQLVLRYFDEVITPEEQELLETRLQTRDADRQEFLDLCEQVSFVIEAVVSPCVPTFPGESLEPQSGSPAIVTFVTDTIQAGANLLSRPFVLSLLFTIVLPGVVLLALIVSFRSQPVPEVARPGAVASADAASAARVTHTYECAWDQESEGVSDGDHLAAGRRLHLNKGLVELRFADGATVLLQGPATFDTLSAGAGFLRSGSLVANVPKAARGFTVRTPDATVVDLGTEFGVSVDATGRKQEVHVFCGEVMLETRPAKTGREPARRRLRAGSAASITLAGGAEEPTVHEIALRAGRFVRRLPASSSAPQPAVVADFSGGQGKSAVDQYPGIPGVGWATSWACQKSRTVACRATVERDEPLSDGGNYLRVLIERTSGAQRFHQAMERKLDVDGPVDLRKPYIVSFSVRIDSMNLFDDQGDLLIFSNNIASKLKRTKLHVTSGWHIRMDSEKGRQGRPQHWAFLSGDGEGNTKRVDSEIPVREGETYSFRVSVDPPARQWVPSIAVNGGERTRFGAMGMRSAGTAEQCRYWPYLCLTWYMAGGNKGGEIERLGFSLDSIRITAAREDDKN